VHADLAERWMEVVCARVLVWVLVCLCVCVRVCP
jgi:hypothetical protein